MKWVVVGAGSGGCVAARRLSDAGHRVVLVEGGPAFDPGAVPPAIDGDDCFAALEVEGRIYDDLVAQRTAGGPEARYLRGAASAGRARSTRWSRCAAMPARYRSWGWDDVEEAWARSLIPVERPEATASSVVPTGCCSRPTTPPRSRRSPAAPVVGSPPPRRTCGHCVRSGPIGSRSAPITRSIASSFDVAGAATGVRPVERRRHRCRRRCARSGRDSHAGDPATLRNRAMQAPGFVTIRPPGCCCASPMSNEPVLDPAAPRTGDRSDGRAGADPGAVAQSPRAVRTG